MDSGRIASLLQPYVSALADAQLGQISAYLDLLLKWNARTNLTSLRDADNIVTRHFGESLFAARHLFGSPPFSRPAREGGDTAIDVGSGAGFPGLPMKIFAPALRLTLIESQNKKATFLKEVVRALELRDVTVFAGRAEDFRERAELVTLRAVEHFESALRAAAQLVAPAGRLGLLIGEGQVAVAREQLPTYAWSEAVNLPGSSRRVLLVGRNQVR